MSNKEKEIVFTFNDHFFKIETNVEGLIHKLIPIILAHNEIKELAQTFQIKEVNETKEHKGE